MDTFLKVLHEIPFSNETPERAGQTRHQLDTLIAATAMEAGLILVTGNQREFGRIKGLSLESWMGSIRV